MNYKHSTLEKNWWLFSLNKIEIFVDNSVLDADGKLRTVKYTADKENGFQASIQKDGHVVHHPQEPVKPIHDQHNPHVPHHANGGNDGGWVIE